MWSSVHSIAPAGAGVKSKRPQYSQGWAVGPNSRIQFHLCPHQSGVDLGVTRETADMGCLRNLDRVEVVGYTRRDKKDHSWQLAVAWVLASAVGVA